MRVYPPATRAVLYDPTVTGPLGALTEQRAFGMLPVANRPLFHHLISQLAAFGIRDVHVFTATHHDVVSDYLGAGEKWGINLKCHRQSAVDDSGLPAELGSKFRGRALVMRIDCWPGKLALRAFLRGSGSRNRQLLGEQGLLPCYCGDTDALLNANGKWPMVYCCAAYALDTPAQYLRANMDALASLSHGNPLEQSHDGELFIGAGCRVSESARFEGRGLIGANSRIGKGVRIGPNVVTGNSVFLDTGCRLKNSIVLAGTYVGSGVVLRNKIADGHRLIDCKSGEVTLVGDRTVLAAPLHQTTARGLAKGLFRWLTRNPRAAA